MDEIKDGELVKWDVEGKRVAGVLVSYKEQATAKGDGHVYNVRTVDGEVAFFAPTLLQQKLARIPVGSVIDITFVDERKTNSGNSVKNFKVLSGAPNAENLALVGLTADMKEEAQPLASEFEENADEAAPM